MTTSSRRGFTLVELLIVIAIIGLLMGLLLPAVQAARERSRMAVCNANQKELALAMTSAKLTGKGTFPGWAYEVRTVSGNTFAVPWTVKLLPLIEEVTLRDQILNGDVDPNQPPVISLFTCPSDASTNPNVGTLSYVVNSGMPDPLGTIPANVEKSDLEANGVCHDQRSGRKGPAVKSGASDIKDGETKTLLLSENVHRDTQNSSFGNATWIGPVQEIPLTPKANNPAVNATMTRNPEQRFGMTWVYDKGYDDVFDPPASDFQPINRGDDEFTDGEYTGAGMRFARPASVHPEVFIVAFCGGNTKEISESIDYRVYQQLMTPNGMKAAFYNSPNASIEEEVRVTQGKGFMTPPLNESDF
jgi:prepilin-type N-terminal cleavage/methylation domain-containing protein